jgi:hypothetical protein
MMLPTQGDRASMGSTLSLACVNIDNKDTVRELREEWSRERVSLYVLYILCFLQSIRKDLERLEKFKYL